MDAAAELTKAVSGDQWSIAADGHEAVVVEVGGGLREYRCDGVAVLDGYGPDELCPGAAGQVLAPWPNRVRDGRYTFGGTAYQLPLTEPERHNAIHGLVNWARWRPAAVARDSITLEHELVPQPGYPWPLVLRTTWEVGAGGLTVTHEATNVGAAPAPFGLATHPYVRVPGVAVDELTLEIPARSRILVDGRLLPIGTARVSGTEYDFTTARRVGAAVLDAAFGDAQHDESGRSTVRVLGPRPGPGAGAAWTEERSDEGRRHLKGPRGPRERSERQHYGVACWADSAFGWWQVFSGDTLDPPRRRRSLAVEPMTCPPDAFRSGRDVVVLEPGQTWRGAWGMYPLED